MKEEFRTPPEISFEPGPGSRLRQAREAANRNIGEISAALHLNPQTVEALEADSFDRLPPPAFVRGYLKGYARLLGLPPGPILEAYDRRGFEPPPLVSDVPRTPQTHPSDLAIRLGAYGIGVILVVLVVLWWRSQDIRGSDILDIGRDLIGWLPESTPASPDGGEGDGGPAAAAGASPGPPEGAGPADDTEPPTPPSGDGPSPGGGIATAEPLPPTDGAAAEGMAVTGSPSPDDGLPFGGAGAGGVDAAEPPSPPSADGAAAEGTAAVESPAGDDPSPGGGAGAGGMAATESPLPLAGEDAVAGGAATTESPPPSTAVDTVAGSVTTSGPPSPPSVDGDDAAAGTIAGAGTIPGPGTAAAPGAETGAGLPEREDAPAPEAPDDTPLVIQVGPPVPATGSSLLVVELMHESWVEIYDRDRTALFFDLVPPGRMLRITGAPPFDILFGNAEGIRMTLDGAPFDYTQYVKRGIARFKAGAAPGDEPDAGAVPPPATPSPGGAAPETPSGEGPRPGF